MWIDSHCHLQLDGRPPGELIARADEVELIVVPGVDAASSRSALGLAAAHPDRLAATVGLHPHDAGKWRTEEGELRELAGSAVAVGETGLDFYRNLAPRQHQLAAFTAQIDLAAELRRPVVVHCRDAFADVHRVIEDSGYGLSTILHCWTGGPRWTRRFLDLGVTFSFAGPVTFPTGDTVRRGAALVPPERALVETDTPYLTPPPHRGSPNEPAFVSLVGAALAELWSIPVEEVARLTGRRAREAFAL